MAAAHGTLTSYGRGCRCEPCRVRHRIYNKRWRARAHNRTPKRHGTEYAYKQLGCHCPLCVDAYRRYNRERMRRVRRQEQRARHRRRFAVEPALAAGRCSLGELARAAGVDNRQASRWKARGLTTACADRVAVALGLHPALVWPNWLKRVS